MAEALPAQDSAFSCSICVDLLKDPVTIPCGHSFCLICIKDCWDQDDQKGIFRCPQCRHTFNQRPALYKNSLIAEMVKKQKKPSPQPTASPESGAVECDICTGKKQKAVKSCLECLVSYCEAHIQSHCKSSPSKKHQLVKASAKIQKTCSRHDKLLELFCHTDQKFVCFMCTMDEHSGHETVSTAVERSQMQKRLVKTQTKLQQGILQRQKKLQELKEAMENLRHSAQVAVEDSEKIFTDLIQSIKKKRSEVKKLIRAQEKAELSHTEELLKKLEQEIADLSRRDTALERLSHTEDHIHFLQRFQSFSGQKETADLTPFNVTPHFSTEELRKAVFGVKEQVDDVCSVTVIKSKGVYTLQPCQPATRKEYQKYYCHLTMDLSTAHKELCLSDGNRKAMWSRKLYFDISDILDECRQVLCEQSVSGRSYWEVLWNGRVHIAISYKDPSRPERQCEFGNNDQSWSLICSDSGFSFRHDNKETKLPVVSGSSRIGVYVDHWAGILSFFSVSDTMTPFLRVKATFTQPLYPGFGVWSRTSFVQICEVC
ncbi:tripartite motif-containing protein 16-like [Astyanax mexicanus]|uniref:Tripartite motif-containing protein 16-like n=1 Tax=Astyanax mexicanus TaxID=7994 RepID=A0A8B9REX3_ASTMX|nr:tripartite motif-containing protein 16-like [Astyanax mexicanus]